MIARIAYRNVQRKMPKVQGILRHRPDVLGLGEPFNIVPRLRGVAGYRTLSGPSQGERDTAVMVRRSRIVVPSWHTVRLSDEVTGHAGVAHERYATVVRYRRRGLRRRYAWHVNFHLTPLRDGLRAVNDAHNDGGDALLALVDRLLDSGEPLTTTGDTNRHFDKGVHAELRKRLRGLSNGVDFVGWSHHFELDTRRVRSGRRWRTDPAWSLIKSDDHNAILTRLRTA